MLRYSLTDVLSSKVRQIDLVPTRPVSTADFERKVRSTARDLGLDVISKDDRRVTFKYLKSPDETRVFDALFVLADRLPDFRIEDGNVQGVGAPNAAEDDRRVRAEIHFGKGHQAACDAPFKDARLPPMTFSSNDSITVILPEQSEDLTGQLVSYELMKLLRPESPNHKLGVRAYVPSTKSESTLFIATHFANTDRTWDNRVNAHKVNVVKQRDAEQGRRVLSDGLQQMNHGLLEAADLVEELIRGQEQHHQELSAGMAELDDLLRRRNLN